MSLMGLERDETNPSQSGSAERRRIDEPSSRIRAADEAYDDNDDDFADWLHAGEKMYMLVCCTRRKTVIRSSQVRGARRDVSGPDGTAFRRHIDFSFFFLLRLQPLSWRIPPIPSAPWASGGVVGIVTAGHERERGSDAAVGDATDLLLSSLVLGLGQYFRMQLAACARVHIAVTAAA